MYEANLQYAGIGASYWLEGLGDLVESSQRDFSEPKVVTAKVVDRAGFAPPAAKFAGSGN